MSCRRFVFTAVSATTGSAGGLAGWLALFNALPYLGVAMDGAASVVRPLVGQVVKASASGAEGPGFESRIFPGRVIPVT